jgi:hypothetical protein
MKEHLSARIAGDIADQAMSMSGMGPSEVLTRAGELVEALKTCDEGDVGAAYQLAVKLGAVGAWMSGFLGSFAEREGEGPWTDPSVATPNGRVLAMARALEAAELLDRMLDGEADESTGTTFFDLGWDPDKESSAEFVVRLRREALAAVKGTET